MAAATLGDPEGEHGQVRGNTQPVGLRRAGQSHHGGGVVGQDGTAPLDEASGSHDLGAGQRRLRHLTHQDLHPQLLRGAQELAGLVLAGVSVIGCGLPHERDDATVPEFGQMIHAGAGHLSEVRVNAGRPTGAIRGADEDGGDLLLQQHRLALITVSHVHENHPAQGAGAHERAQLDQRRRGGHDRNDDLDSAGRQCATHTIDVVQVVGVNGGALAPKEDPHGAQHPRGQ